jgi:thymidine kinase
MPTLSFKYGTMNSSKTANLLMKAYNYLSKDKKVFLIKPEIDVRYNQDSINSRAVKSMKADLMLSADEEDIQKYVEEGTICILVDEAQFLSVKNVESLRKISKTIDVICYGLRTDYKSNLFEGSKRLFELADKIEEIKTICVSCNKNAIINSKFITKDQEKIIIKSGSDKPDLGAEEKYQPMCWDCWDKSEPIKTDLEEAAHEITNCFGK